MTKYSVTMDRNTPTLCVDKKEVPPVLFCLSDFPGAKSNTAYARRNIRNFAEKGIHLVGADIGLHVGWRRVSGFEVEPLIEEIGGVLDANPDARILLRLHVNPPYWWLRDHPEECVLYRTEEGDVPGIDDGEHMRLIRGDMEGHMRVSLASKVWIQEVCERLVIFLKTLEGTREGDALMAVQVACGMNGEWHHWGTDVSRPMRVCFEQYLREKYKTVEELRRAWKDSEVTFETAEYHPEVTPPGDEGGFRDPEKSQCAIDSLISNQKVTVDTILKFCSVVKETAPHLLCGTFYGYYLDTGFDTRVITGHLAVDRLYEKKELVDFLCGPFCYLENRKSDKIPMQRALLESNRLHGMLWLTEMDDHPVGTEKYVGGDPAALDETIYRLRRETLLPLLKGMGFWFYDHRIIPSLMPPDSENSVAGSIWRKNGWWEKTQLMEEIGKLRNFAEKLMEKPYTPAADVLVVYDTDSYYYRARVIEDEYGLHDALARSGVVFDCIYAKDLELCEVSRYKCVIFANSYMLTPGQRENYHRLTRGRMAVYLGAYGYCDGETLSEKNISDAVGMKMKKLSGADSVCLQVSDQNRTGAAEKINAEIRIPEGYGPLFAVEEPDAEILAFYNTGEIAAARKGQDIYVGNPFLTPEFAAYLLKEAGAHRWCDSDEFVIAGFGYAALNCQHAGVRTLMLPGGRNITVSTEGYETVLYEIASGKRIL